MSQPEQSYGESLPDIFQDPPTISFFTVKDGGLLDRVVDLAPGQAQIQTSIEGLPLKVDVKTSGLRWGDAGHGGFIDIRVENQSPLDAALVVADEEVASTCDRSRVGSLRSFGIRLRGGQEYEKAIFVLKSLTAFLERCKNLSAVGRQS